MGLSGWETPTSLYLARGDEVSKFRPLFTGDVFHGVKVPGVEDADGLMLVAHPCAMRAGPILSKSILAVAVRKHAAQAPSHWSKGFFNRMPLPDLHDDGDSFHVGWLEQMASVATEQLEQGTRIACLSTVGVNLLQQRLIFHLTRLEVETSTLWTAFSHTYEESDLLEEWIEGLHNVDPAPAESFDLWLRDGSPTRQDRIKDVQYRSQVRVEMRAEIARRVASIVLP